MTRGTRKGTREGGQEKGGKERGDKDLEDVAEGALADECDDVEVAEGELLGAYEDRLQGVHPLEELRRVCGPGPGVTATRLRPPPHPTGRAGREEKAGWRESRLGESVRGEG